MFIFPIKDIVYIAVILLTSLSSLSAFLYITKFRLSRLEEDVKILKDRIENLDKRFVSKEIFERENKHTRDSLEEIKDMVQKLLSKK